MNKKHLFIFAIIFSQSVISLEEKKVKIYTSPVMLEVTGPSYPQSEGRKGVEGWVVVNFMVSAEGNIFEPSIVGSTGSKKFEDNALKALEGGKYKPASLDGKPVEGSSYIRFQYSLENKWVGARNRFVNRHKRFVKAIRDNDKKNAKKFIDRYRDESDLNNYERAYLNFDRASYAKLYGTKLEEMRYLNTALLFEGDYDDDSRFLPPELILSVRRQLYMAQTETNYFYDAMRSYYLIRNKHGEEAVSDFQAAHEKMQEILKSNIRYGIPARTNGNGLWTINLFKSNFSINSKDSIINELKLRCEKKFVFFAFKEGDKHEIPKSWGACNLQVLGAADSEFDLVQY